MFIQHIPPPPTIIWKVISRRFWGQPEEVGAYHPYTGMRLGFVRRRFNGEWEAFPSPGGYTQTYMDMDSAKRACASAVANLKDRP